MEYKDYYQVLGVPKDAKPEDIQKAYRKLARKHHPDVNKSPGAENRFKEINEAHQALSDPEKRSKYDHFGSAWQQAQQTGQPPHGFEDIFSAFGVGGGGGRGFSSGGFDPSGERFSSFFEMLFGGAPGQGRATRGGGRRARAGTAGGWTQPAADLSATLRLTLEEAAHGGVRQISLSDPNGRPPRTLRVQIPAGVKPGQRIRLGGQAFSGGGGGAGDLYLTIELAPHARFRLEGADLYTTLAVTPWEAVLGGQANLATLDGTVTVRIPPGSCSGRKIRLRDKGFPTGKQGRGDLYAEIRIVVPEHPSEQDKALFEELARTSAFRAREP